MLKIIENKIYEPSHPKLMPNGNVSNFTPGGKACLNQPKINNKGSKVTNVAGSECCKYFKLVSIDLFCISISFWGSFLNFCISFLKYSVSSFKDFIACWFVKNFIARFTIKVKINEIIIMFQGFPKEIIGPNKKLKKLSNAIFTPSFF